MKSRTRVSTILAIILLTLFLHFLFLYFFTTIPFGDAPGKISEFLQKLLDAEPAKNKVEEQRELQSHAPQSAPVIFRDSPEEQEPPMPQPKPVQQAPEPPKTLVSHASGPMDKPKEAEDKEHPSSTSGRTVKKEPKLEAPEVEEDQDEGPSTNRDERREEKQIPPEQEKSTPHEPKKKTPKRKLENTMLADFDIQETPKKSTVAKNTLPSVRPDLLRGRPSVRPEELRDRKSTRERSENNSQKKHVSLADLSNQYMQKATESDSSGYGALRVQGNTQYGHPSAYQIALERYVAKMCKEVETAYRIGTNQSLQSTQHKPFYLLVELNADGRVSTIYPSPSSGIARIDEFAMSIFRSASKSFPKLPDAIGKSFRIQFEINHIDHLANLGMGVLHNR